MLSRHSVVVVLAVRFRVAQMLDSLVSAVSLFRLVRMLAAVVEDSCTIPFPSTADDQSATISKSSGDTQTRASTGSRLGGSSSRGTAYRWLGRESNMEAIGLRVHVHQYGMSVIFDDPSRVSRQSGHLPTASGGIPASYCPVLHAAFAASAAICRVEALERRLGAKLSLSAAVHVGGVVLGTVGAEGQAWDAYGKGMQEAMGLASAAAAVVPPDRSCIAYSRQAVSAAACAPEPLMEGMTTCVGPRVHPARQKGGSRDVESVLRSASVSSKTKQSASHSPSPSRDVAGLAIRTPNGPLTSGGAKVEGAANGGQLGGFPVSKQTAIAVGAPAPSPPPEPAPRAVASEQASGNTTARRNIPEGKHTGPGGLSEIQEDEEEGRLDAHLNEADDSDSENERSESFESSNSSDYSSDSNDEGVTGIDFMTGQETTHSRSVASTGTMISEAGVDELVV